MYQKQGKHEKALADADAAVSLRKDWAKGYFRKGLSLHGMGRHEEAFKIFYECLTIEMVCGGVDVKSDECRSLLECAKQLYCVIENIVKFRKYQNTRNLSNEASKTLLGNSAKNIKYVASANSTQCLFTIDHSTSTSKKGSASLNVNKHCFLQTNTFLQQDDSDDSSSSDSEGEGQLCLEVDGSCDDTRSPSLNVSKLIPDFIRGLVDYVSILSENSNKLEVVSKPNEEWYVRGLLSYRAQYRSINQDAIDSADYECPLCMRLLWQPITTPCGHTFCRVCLDRSLDHNSVCPMCKSAEVKKVYLVERREFVPNEFIDASMKRLIPVDYQERKNLQQQEMSEFGGGTENANVIPVFVCTVSLPGIPCPLHVFEPRYRLMVRRAMESGAREFGMSCNIDEQP